MILILDSMEIRILGCLIEKQFVTPDVYPMTINSLKNACNQKSSRDPVVEYDEKTVRQTVDRLRGKGLAMFRSETGSRADKYEHLLPSVLELDRKETVVLSLLMLRGPQTIGEIKNRSGRMYPFEDTAQIEEVLNRLASRERPLAVHLPRQAGMKERRYMHLLSGEPDLEPVADFSAEPAVQPVPGPAPETRPRSMEVPGLKERVDQLESDLQNLREEFREFRKQFE